MDDLDKRILDVLQQGLEICERPYQAVADAAGVSERDVIERIQKLKEDGIIRRVSAFFDPRGIGYKSTLCAVKIPEDKIETAVAIINSFDEVTHNYLRDNELFNVWFTVIAIGDEGIEEVVSDIQAKLGLAISNFSSVDFYKIKVNFNLEETS